MTGKLRIFKIKNIQCMNLAYFYVPIINDKADKKMDLMHDASSIGINMLVHAIVYLCI